MQTHLALATRAGKTARQEDVKHRDIWEISRQVVCASRRGGESGGKAAHCCVLEGELRRRGVKWLVLWMLLLLFLVFLPSSGWLTGYLLAIVDGHL